MTKTPRRLWILPALGLAFAGCGKEVTYSSDNATINSVLSAKRTSCPSGNAALWTFTQAPYMSSSSTGAGSGSGVGTGGPALDVLVVTNPAPGLAGERAQLASALPAALAAALPTTDLRMAVMLGHGAAAGDAGKLYSPNGTPTVLELSSLTTGQLQADLAQDLNNPPADADGADGKALFYSLNRGLQADRLADARAAGFLRTGAALSVVFLSNVSDLCFRPDLNGYSAFPDFVVPGDAAAEATAYNAYCTNPAITPLSTLLALRSLQGLRPLSLAAVAHFDGAKVASGSGDEIGHGMLELLGLTANDQAVELTASSYASGFDSLAALIAAEEKVETRFVLDSRATVQADTLSVFVDGKACSSSYDSSTRTVELRSTEAGQPGSEVNVMTCQ